MNADEVVMFALDPEDLDTDLDVTPWEGGGGSFVGALPREGDDELSRALAEVERVCAAFDSVDPSGVAAETALRKRVGWLALLVRATRAVRAIASREAPCDAYVSSIETWTLDVSASLANLARELNVLEPRWSAFRERLAAAGWIAERVAREETRLASDYAALPEEVRAALDELAVAFATFTKALDEPMG